jgi:hypothetical protein
MDDYRLLDQAGQEANKRHADENNEQLQQLQAEMEKCNASMKEACYARRPDIGTRTRNFGVCQGTHQICTHSE